MAAQELGSVAVIGGGLAGMTAAWALMRAGHHVTLVERRPYLGGRAYSFVDQETGMEVDNGQHVFLGCNTAFADLLADVGSLDRTFRQRRLRIEVRSPSGAVGVLGASPLPAPLHLLPSFFRYPHMGLRDKLRAIPALLRIRAERHRDRDALRDRSFGAWLAANGQSDHAIANFWDVIVVPALNDVSRDVSASMGFMVFQEALLRDSHGADVGFARAGLSGLLGHAFEARLREGSATLLLGHTAAQVVVDDASRVAYVELADGERVTADWYVSALPPGALLGLLPPEVSAMPGFAPAATHTWSPIVNLHVWYDRPIGDFDFVAFVDSPVQWVFNRTGIAGLDGPGQYITLSQSGAWTFWPLSKEELRELFLPELARLFPRSAEAGVERFIVVKEQHATFRSLPGTTANRLPTRSPLSNLLLAGDWTDTGWPATMESAVRSGNAAAAAASDALTARGADAPEARP